MNPLEEYLQAISAIRSSGVATPETSYYGALERLFNEVGKTLKPKVQCIISRLQAGADRFIQIQEAYHEPDSPYLLGGRRSLIGNL